MEMSVLIPCYNIEPFGEIAINSILEQTFTDFELILLNDGSTDSTAEILSRVASTDSRVRVINHPQNKGIIAARNSLLEAAKGKLLAWMDADDIAMPDRLQKQRDFLLNNSDHVAVSCEYIEFSETTQYYRGRTDKDLSRDFLLFYNYVLNPGAMVWRSTVVEHHIVFNNHIAGASDFQFWVDVVKHGKIGVIHEPLMRYRRHDQQESTAQLQRQLLGCQQIVCQQLTSIGITGITPEDMAQFLVYPADLRKLCFDLRTFKKSAFIVKVLRQKLPNNDYTQEAVIQAIHLLRRHLVRAGWRAIPSFIHAVGWREFLQSKHFGLALCLASIKQVY